MLSSQEFIFVPIENYRSYFVCQANNQVIILIGEMHEILGSVCGQIIDALFHQTNALMDVLVELHYLFRK